MKEGDEPVKNQIYDNVQKGLDAYYAYAEKAGFECRLGGHKYEDGKLMYRYAICSCAGECKSARSNMMKPRQRKRKSKRSKCQAQICLKWEDDEGRYSVSKFIKEHNHKLFTDATKHMSKHVRKLNFFDKAAIYNLSNSNYGGTKAHHIVTGLMGGDDEHGPKTSDYKNFASALNAVMENTDANDVVGLLEERKEMFPTFSFDYLLEDQELRGLFWADDIAKRNYLEFNDLVSFDGTYRTNK